MYPEHTMWWPMAGMWIFPIIFIVLIIFVVFLAMARGGRWPAWFDSGREHGESAIDILNKRYAKGEITKDDFEQMKKDIQG